jgi:hypothetical protein
MAVLAGVVERIQAVHIQAVLVVRETHHLLHHLKEITAVLV